MQRLFSTFAHGWPGSGLLILRLVVGGVASACGFSGLRAAQFLQPAILDFAALTCGLLLLIGLWTPVSSGLIAALSLWNLLTRSGDLGETSCLRA